MREYKFKPSSILEALRAKRNQWFTGSEPTGTSVEPDKIDDLQQLVQIEQPQSIVEPAPEEPLEFVTKDESTELDDESAKYVPERRNKHEIPQYDTISEWATECMAALQSLQDLRNPNSITDGLVMPSELYEMLQSKGITVSSLPYDTEIADLGGDVRLTEKYGIGSQYLYGFRDLTFAIRFFAQRTNVELLEVFGNQQDKLVDFSQFLNSIINRARNYEDWQVRNRDQVLADINNANTDSQTVLLEQEMEALQSFLRENNNSFNPEIQKQYVQVFNLLQKGTFFGADELQFFHDYTYAKIGHLDLTGNALLFDNIRTLEAVEHIQRMAEDMKALFLKEKLGVSVPNMWKKITGSELNFDCLENIKEKDVPSSLQAIKDMLSQLNAHTDVLTTTFLCAKNSDSHEIYRNPNFFIESKPKDERITSLNIDVQKFSPTKLESYSKHPDAESIKITSYILNYFMHIKLRLAQSIEKYEASIASQQKKSGAVNDSE